MQDKFDESRGDSELPHNHDYFSVVFINSAKGKHIIDFNEYCLNPNQVYFISPGQVHQLLESERPDGYGMTFSYQFLVKNNIPISFIENLNLFNDFGETPPLVLDEMMHQKIGNYIDEIYKTSQSELIYKEEAIGALLKLMLIQCNNACTLPQEAFSAKKDSILRQYKSLINTHYKEWHTTKEYANKLHVTPDHLNRVVKKQTGKTAKEHIQSRIILAAKRLFYFTLKTNKEIAYELGFSEPANFSAFFKNRVGLSPSNFKSMI